MLMHLIKKINLLKPLVLNKKPEIYLTSSIVLETACTVCLSKVNQNYQDTIMCKKDVLQT